MDRVVARRCTVALAVVVGALGAERRGEAASPGSDLPAPPCAAGFEASPGRGELDALTARLAAVVQRAGALRSTGGETLLPAGAKLDALTFEAGGVARVSITLPARCHLDGIQPMRAVAIERVLARVLTEDRPLSGISVWLRVGDGPAEPIEAHLPRFDPPPDSDVSDDTGKTAAEAIEERKQAQNVEGQAPAAFGGPIANADGQPQGALSGVVVFVSAGHGWTDKSPDWYLQRPLLLDMVEDYGNLEQINYFVHYLYNAGAVVVPFRPVGYQPIEIVIDNDDPGATFTGSWSDSITTSGYYENGVTTSGIPYRWAVTNPTETATARYTPIIAQSDFYPVYVWTKDDTDRVEQTYRIRHSGGTAQVTIDHTRVGKGWMWLGNFHFEAGADGYVEITNASPQSGVVIADAIRFGNGIGDVVGAGTGHVSGYPREEEASRYWAESEAGINAVGPPSSIWDCCDTDGSDNVGTAARWSAYMNRRNINDDRWRRAYVEFHSNAAGCSGGPPCGAKGTVALVSSNYPTTNQWAFSTIVGDKIEADMRLIDDEFEYEWGLRNNPYSGGFGAISTYNNDDEFDATLVEVAFHDNVEDTANLLSAKVRSAVARSTVQGLIMFLNSLPDSGPRRRAEVRAGIQPPGTRCTAPATATGSATRWWWVT